MKKITFTDSPDDSDYRIKGEEYVGEYINNNTPIEVFCRQHNCRYTATPSSILNKLSC